MIRVECVDLCYGMCKKNKNHLNTEIVDLVLKANLRRANYSSKIFWSQKKAKIVKDF